MGCWGITAFESDEGLDTLLESSKAETELIPLQRPEYQEMENSREAEHPLQNQLGL